MSEGRIVAAGTFAELEMAKQSNAQLQVRHMRNLEAAVIERMHKNKDNKT
jgi:ABC-type tungstate transport system permease subunit